MRRILSACCVVVFWSFVMSLSMFSLRCEGRGPADKTLRVLRCTNSYGGDCMLTFTADHDVIVPESSFITVTPPVEISVQKHYWRSNVLVISGPFKAEQSYTVRVRAGVRSSEGGKTGYDAVFRYKLPRLSSELRMLSKGVFMPLHRKNLSLPLEMVNASTLDVTLRRVLLESLIPYSGTYVDEERYMPVIGKKRYDISMVDNEKESFEFDVSGMLPERKPGLYMVGFSVWDKGKAPKEVGLYRDDRLQYFNVTDLSVSMGMGEGFKDYHVHVRTLSDHRLVAGADVTMYGCNNAVVFKGKTDENGFCKVSLDSTIKDAVNAPYLLLVKYGDDITYMMLETEESETLRRHENIGVTRPHPTHYETAGRGESGGPEAFVYFERGVARPGETVTASVFVRQREKDAMSVLKDYPFTMSFIAPDGGVVKTLKVKTDAHGYAFQPFELDKAAMTGTYKVVCSTGAGTSIGESSVIAATYVADRIRVEAKVDKEIVRLGESVQGSCKAEYYFGGSAETAKATLEYQALERELPAHWREYEVGDAEAPIDVSGMEHQFKQLGAGQTLSYSVDKDLSFTLPVKMVFSASVQEPGGRVVTGKATFWLDSCGWYLGLRAEESANSEARLGYCALGVKRGELVKLPAGTEAVAEIYRVSWEMKTVMEDGRYERRWERVKRKHGEDMKIALTEAKGILSLGDLPDGGYEVVVKVGEHRRTRMEFWHWAGEGGRRSPDPNTLTFTTNQETYKPGDVAEISFDVDESGYAVVSCGVTGYDSVYAMELKPGKNTCRVTIPSTLLYERYYCAVTAVSGAGDATRVFGVTALKVDQSAHRMNVSIDAPKIACPGTDVEVKVRLTDESGKPVQGVAQVALVDCGVLALTGYTTPDIHGFFHGGRRYGMSFYDNFGLFYPDLKLQGLRKIGGDRIVMTMSSKLSDIVMEKSQVMFFAPVATDAEGIARLKVRVPEFQGALRITCVASSASSVGSFSDEMIVRDKLGVMASGPRAVAPGDSFELTYSLRNFDLPDGEYQFSVDLPEGLSAEGDVRRKGVLKKDVEEIVRLRVRSQGAMGRFEIGHGLTVGTASKRGTLGVTVRSANPPTCISEKIVLDAGQTCTVAVDPKEWVGGSGKGSLTLSTLPLSGLSDGLQWLNDYPYGCLEQTTACAFPYLKLEQLAKLGVVNGEEVKTLEEMMLGAFSRIRTMYLGIGHFSLWPGHDSYALDATLFASHFIAELSKRHELDSSLLKAIRDNLREFSMDGCEPVGQRSYACYILSLLERSGGTEEEPVHVLAARNILAHERGNFACLLASASLILSGYASEGMPLLQESLEREAWNEQNAPYGLSCAASRVGMALYVLMSVDPGHQAADKLAMLLNGLIRKDGGCWGTTQSNAWACLGLAVYGAHVSPGKPSYSVKVSGDVVQTVAEKGDSAPLVRWQLGHGGVVTLSNTGGSKLYLTKNLSGVPQGRLQSLRGTLNVRRHILDSKGMSVTHASQGDLLTVVLEIEALCNVSDLVLVDMLAGGLEIEDPLLATRAVSPKKSQVESCGLLVPKYIERRDDRLVLCGDFSSRGTARFTYTVRAVSRGVYRLPPVILEAMYAPDLRAVDAWGDTFIVE